MANTDSADTPAKRETTRRSFRGYVDAQGNDTDKIEEAVGSFFALRTEDGKGIAKRWVDTLDDLIETDKMRAIGYFCLGHQTKHGNEANTVFNPGAGKSPGSIQDAIDWIDEWRGQSDWARERTGPRTDLEKLAEAVVNVSPADAFGGLTPEQAKAALMAKFEASPELVRDTLNTPDFGNEYRRITARKVEDKATTLAKLFA